MKPATFHIGPNDDIRHVQQHFSQLFPSMQLIFFRDPDNSRKTDQCIMFSPETRVDTMNDSFHDLSIQLTPEMRVADIEKILKTSGLHAQISCKIMNRQTDSNSVYQWRVEDIFEMETPRFPVAPSNNKFKSNHWHSVLK